MYEACEFNSTLISLATPSPIGISLTPFSYCLCKLAGYQPEQNRLSKVNQSTGPKFTLQENAEGFRITVLSSNAKICLYLQYQECRVEELGILSQNIWVQTVVPPLTNLHSWQICFLSPEILIIN